MVNVDLESYRKNGYLIFEKFFPENTIQKVLWDAKNVFLKIIHQKGIASRSLEDMSEAEFNEALYKLFEVDLNSLINCGKQAQHIISLHRLSLDQKIEDLLITVGLKRPSISTRPVLYFNHSRLAQKKVFYKVDAHQDWRSMQGSLNSVVIWAPLVTIDKDLGALEVLP